MAETYHDDLLDNYESLREDREWSRELMAETIEQQDPALAAQYRKHFADDAAQAKAPAKKAPAKRQSKASAEQTEA